MTEKFSPANSLWVDLKTDDDTVIISYKIDTSFQGEMRIRFPFHLSGDQDIISLLGLFSAGFIAQLCLSREIILNFPSPSSMLEYLNKLLTNLYDVRSYRENLEILAPPHIYLTKSTEISSRRIEKNKKACLLWSGGVDSTLSAILLKELGYQIQGVSSNINIDASNSEKKAVQNLSKVLDVDIANVDIEFSQFTQISNAFSNAFRVYPYENSVPHGRELILFPISLILSLKMGYSQICFGHEHEAWTKQIIYKGKSIFRCDTQSSFANYIFDEIVKKFVSPHMSIFSPVSGLTDFNKFSIVAKNWEGILSLTSSCFWGNFCGDCPKCVSYFLYQRAIEKEIFEFNLNPLVNGNALLEAYTKKHNRSNLFTIVDYHFSLSKIIENNDIRAGEIFLIKYAKDIYPTVKDKLPRMENDLATIYPDPLLPSEFVLFLNSIRK